MRRHPYSDLLALIAVARERNFTRAAAQLGMSQSMLSHTIREMESRLGVRLLTRTTRSVSVTEAGARLMANVAPRLDDIEAELHAVSDMREVPAGTVRITATDHSIDTLLWPRLSKALAAYPQIRLELSDDYAMTDIVHGRFDFGVRLGDGLTNEVSAVRIGPDLSFAIVGTPDYLARHPPLNEPEDLLKHDCINLRLPTRGNLYAWELQCGDRAMSVRVDGRLVFNGIYQVLNAALSGYGLAYVPHDLARPHIEAGRLVGVLEPCWMLFPGYHLFFASQRGITRAMSVVMDALHYPD